jgi:Na+-transporting NADH:ubiquinone oxidoreductase subunit NqrB
MDAALLTRDPRHYQIAVLASLLAWGLVGLDLEVRPAVAATVVATALAVQWLGGKAAGLARFDPRSALISALSLTLLLRTASPALAALAAALTIGGKFVIRIPGPGGGKHLFNPTNFGIAATLLLTDRAWVSPGQWGSAALGAFAVACAGFLVVRRAERSDVTWAFLAAYSAVLVGRALWLGDPLAIPLHQLSNGAFLIFAFFMISDPKTTPDSRAGRVLFALLVALGAGFVHFYLFRPNGLIWSLAALSPLVPLIDRLLPGRRYRWPGGRSVAAGGEAAPLSVVPVPSPRPAGAALAIERSR